MKRRRKRKIGICLNLCVRVIDIDMGGLVTIAVGVKKTLNFFLLHLFHTHLCVYDNACVFVGGFFCL